MTARQICGMRAVEVLPNGDVVQSVEIKTRVQRDLGIMSIVPCGLGTRIEIMPIFEREKS